MNGIWHEHLLEADLVKVTNSVGGRISKGHELPVFNIRQ